MALVLELPMAVLPAPPPPPWNVSAAVDVLICATEPPANPLPLAPPAPVAVPGSPPAADTLPPPDPPVMVLAPPDVGAPGPVQQ